MKQMLDVARTAEAHWVGDGFFVRSVFSPQTHGAALSPFLLLDHAAPHEFAPTDRPRGVGSHPHRGFETVTVVYQGELEHRDSAGHAGSIGPGDVQWMTAGAGVLHEERHGRAFSRRGGVLEMAQLWVNLPARHKSAAPGYQEIRAADVPEVRFDGGSARAIAGEFRGVRGPARTFTPMGVFDVRLTAGARLDVPAPAGHVALAFVLRGGVTSAGRRAEGGDLAVFGREGEGVAVEAAADAVLLVLTGEPIDEPVAAYGPFVMNTADEIRQAMQDFREGRMGRLAD